MLPVALLFWLLLEIACYLAIGRFLFAAPWPYALGGAVGGLLGLRAGLNMITWLFGMAFASPAPRLGAARTAQLMLQEFGAYLLDFLLVIPLERLWMPPDRLFGGGRVILLVHGYGCSRGVWWLLRRRLEAAGHTVASISLVPPFADIDLLADQLHERIEAVCATTGSRQITLLAHSMGGLVCRACLARHGGDRISRLLTLAAPHGGSELARLGIGPAARQMEADSPWLAQLNAVPVTVPVLALRSPYDNYVMPQDRQVLPGARSLNLPPVGHLAQLTDRRVARLLIDLLKDN